RPNTQRLPERADPAAAKPTAVQPPAPSLPPATAIDDVIIRPLATKPSLFLDPVDDTRPPAEPPYDGYVPPAPERPMRQPRMPRLEDLPIPAQNEIRASRGEIHGPNPEKRRTSLLQRLASVGLGRRE